MSDRASAGSPAGALLRKPAKTLSLAADERRPAYPYDFMIFIGRFRPFHEGHRAVMRRALELGRQLIVLVGSCRQARSQRNPLTFEEVRDCILGAFPDPSERDRILLLPLIDRYNDVEWSADVQAAVRAAVAREPGSAGGSPPRICLIGRSQARSGYYPERFPQWASENVEDVGGISATPIREDYFRNAGAALAKWAACLPGNVVEFLRCFAQRPEYRDLAAEAAWVRGFRERWLGGRPPFRDLYFQDAAKAIAEEGANLQPGAADFLAEFAGSEAYRRLADETSLAREVRPRWTGAPYPPVFHTVDAVVLQAGYILLIERRSLPGKGLLALPGGYIGEHERIQDSMIRELREETRLKVPASVLVGSIKARRDFDHPYRSARGRIITTAFLIQLAASGEGLPRVRGGDDARCAFWLPLDEIEPERMFEDHYHIIQTMVPLAAP
jgi:bifunctional NMN adenylyltransferase/nudix hydrolase